MAASVAMKMKPRWTLICVAFALLYQQMVVFGVPVKRSSGGFSSFSSSSSSSLSSSSTCLCPSHLLDSGCPYQGFFSHDQDCGKYILCAPGLNNGHTAYVAACPEGKEFSRTLRTCVEPHLSGCGRSEIEELISGSTTHTSTNVKDKQEQLEFYLKEYKKLLTTLAKIKELSIQEVGDSSTFDVEEIGFEFEQPTKTSFTFEEIFGQGAHGGSAHVSGSSLKEFEAEMSKVIAEQIRKAVEAATATASASGHVKEFEVTIQEEESALAPSSVEIIKKKLVETGTEIAMESEMGDYDYTGTYTGAETGTEKEIVTSDDEEEGEDEYGYEAPAPVPAIETFTVTEFETSSSSTSATAAAAADFVEEVVQVVEFVEEVSKQLTHAGAGSSHSSSATVIEVEEVPESEYVTEYDADFAEVVGQTHEESEAEYDAIAAEEEAEIEKIEAGWASSSSSSSSPHTQTETVQVFEVTDLVNAELAPAVPILSGVVTEVFQGDLVEVDALDGLGALDATSLVKQTAIADQVTELLASVGLTDLISEGNLADLDVAEVTALIEQLQAIRANQAQGLLTIDELTGAVPVLLERDVQTTVEGLIPVPIQGGTVDVARVLEILRANGVTDGHVLEIVNGESLGTLSEVVQGGDLIQLLPGGGGVGQVTDLVDLELGDLTDVANLANLDLGGLDDTVTQTLGGLVNEGGAASIVTGLLEETGTGGATTIVGELVQDGAVQNAGSLVSVTEFLTNGGIASELLQNQASADELTSTVYDLVQVSNLGELLTVEEGRAGAEGSLLEGTVGSLTQTLQGLLTQIWGSSGSVVDLVQGGGGGLLNADVGSTVKELLNGDGGLADGVVAEVGTVIGELPVVGSVLGQDGAAGGLASGQLVKGLLGGGGRSEVVEVEVDSIQPIKKKKLSASEAAAAMEELYLGQDGGHMGAADAFEKEHPQLVLISPNPGSTVETISFTELLPATGLTDGLLDLDVGTVEDTLTGVVASLDGFGTGSVTETVSEVVTNGEVVSTVTQTVGEIVELDQLPNLGSATDLLDVEALTGTDLGSLTTATDVLDGGLLSTGTEDIVSTSTVTELVDGKILPTGGVTDVLDVYGDLLSADILDSGLLSSGSTGTATGTVTELVNGEVLSTVGGLVEGDQLSNLGSATATDLLDVEALTGEGGLTTVTDILGGDILSSGELIPVSSGTVTELVDGQILSSGSVTDVLNGEILSTSAVTDALNGESEIVSTDILTDLVDGGLISNDGVADLVNADLLSGGAGTVTELAGVDLLPSDAVAGVLGGELLSTADGGLLSTGAVADIVDGDVLSTATGTSTVTDLLAVNNGDGSLASVTEVLGGEGIGDLVAIDTVPDLAGADLLPSDAVAGILGGDLLSTDDGSLLSSGTVTGTLTDVVGGQVLSTDTITGLVSGEVLSTDVVSDVLGGELLSTDDAGLLSSGTVTELADGQILGGGDGVVDLVDIETVTGLLDTDSGAGVADVVGILGRDEILPVDVVPEILDVDVVDVLSDGPLTEVLDTEKLTALDLEGLADVLEGDQLGTVTDLEAVSAITDQLTSGDILSADVLPIDELGLLESDGGVVTGILDGGVLPTDGVTDVLAVGDGDLLSSDGAVGGLTGDILSTDGGGVTDLLADDSGLLSSTGGVTDLLADDSGLLSSTGGVTDTLALGSLLSNHGSQAEVEEEEYDQHETVVSNVPVAGGLLSSGGSQTQKHPKGLAGLPLQGGLLSHKKKTEVVELETETSTEDFTDKTTLASSHVSGTETHRETTKGQSHSETRGHGHSASTSSLASGSEHKSKKLLGL